MKKILSSLLGLALVLGVTGSVFAQEAAVKKETSESITINGYQLEGESNNKTSLANAINSGRLGKLSSTDTVDFYKFTAPSSGSVTVELSGVPNDIPYVVGVFEGSFQGYIAASSETGTSRTATFNAVAGKTYYFEVFSTDNYDTSGNYYLIRLL